MFEVSVYVSKSKENTTLSTATEKKGFEVYNRSRF